MEIIFTMYDVSKKVRFTDVLSRNSSSSFANLYSWISELVWDRLGWRGLIKKRYVGPFKKKVAFALRILVVCPLTKDL